MIIARTLEELTKAHGTLKNIGFVPTMGALHHGHLALLEAAKVAGFTPAASIFVNPTQFGPKEDLSVYPRDEIGDIEKLQSAGCNLLWLPDVGTMYPAGCSTTVQVGTPSLKWEGQKRPGHFNGVATVVTKLFAQIKPKAAFFGEKDWQQVQVIKQVVKDLCLPVKIITVPTVRDQNGLALSSRNQYLHTEEKQIAPLFYKTLQQTAEDIINGETPPNALLKAEKKLLKSGFSPDYIALVHAETLEPINKFVAPARLIAAAQLGHVRLLDNLPLS